MRHRHHQRHPPRHYLFIIILDGSCEVALDDFDCFNSRFVTMGCHLRRFVQVHALCFAFMFLHSCCQGPLRLCDLCCALRQGWCTGFHLLPECLEHLLNSIVRRDCCCCQFC